MERPPEKCAGWRAWYAGTVYDSIRTPASELPPTGLLHVISYFTRANKLTRRAIYTGQQFPERDKWYVFYPDLTIGTYEGIETPATLRGDTVMIRGDWASDAIYNQVTTDAWNYKWQLLH